MTIQELHDHLFEVLCTVDDICTKENVRYFLDSGTEIGAVREHDFIAWDDDADIKVLAEDYPAFKAAMEKNLPPYMHLVEPEDFAPGFYDFIVRIYDERYFLRKDSPKERYYHNYQNHAGTDVFVFTKVPDSAWIKKWLILSTKIFYGLGMAHRYQVDHNKYRGVQKLQVAVLSTLGKVIPARNICRWWWENVQRYQNQEAAFRFCSNYSLKSLQMFSENIYDGVAYFPIRGRLFPVPSGYHDELTQQYGDYMKPPEDISKYETHLD